MRKKKLTAFENIRLVGVHKESTFGPLPGEPKCKLSYKQLQAELEAYRWIPVEERLPQHVEHYAVTDGLEWWRELWCFVDHSGAKGWEDNPGVITHWKPEILPEQALKDNT